MKCYSDWLKLKTTKDKQRKGGKLVAERKKQLWPSGSTMNVKFGHIKNWRDEDGEPITKDAILKIANKWHECNPQVVPKFIPCGPDNTDSDIRVEFVENGVSWSLVGAEAKDEDTNNPTMELDLGSHYRFTILHEFGHALGLQHEHQHPKAPKLYNEQMLNKFLKDNRGIKPEDVEQEKIDNWARLEEAELMGEYDEKSVMHYLIEMDVQDHSCTRGPTVTPTELSEGDKKYIVQFYSREVMGPLVMEERSKKVMLPMIIENTVLLRQKGLQWMWMKHSLLLLLPQVSTVTKYTQQMAALSYTRV
ncbi:hypothetical protein GBAR_LOCUS4921 [Geodia barretti]|uniref:Peptidase metallopeptidase domain-containing protein n=1 Tax=Geodia barretti TaxID=519541 RepID=A0AA35RAK1_GEOBA|nr:hypothetical protein GBAR_LOCUS4921 [Geodia barretti]